MKKLISVFTDGSCHQNGVGAWAAIVLCEDRKILLSGMVTGTTHQRMELTAALNAIQYLRTQKMLHDSDISIFTDSQYLANLPARQDTLAASGFRTRSHQPISNADLVQLVLECMSGLAVQFVKVRAHEKVSADHNYNREVDMMARKIVRDSVKNSFSKSGQSLP